MSNSLDLLASIRQLLNESRAQLFRSVNNVMVKTYWEVGRLIVEDEQQGKKNASYGQYQLQNLSKQLQAEFGKGFHERNLRYMRAFYLNFPIWNAVRSELSWTHYRILLRVENLKAREWYINESIINS